MAFKIKDGKEYYVSPTDRTPWVVGIAIALVFGLSILGIFLSPVPIDDSPRVGDVWEFYGTGDPFKVEETYTRRIIGIKKNYIQFIENDKDTLTRTVPVFRFNTEMIYRQPIVIEEVIEEVVKDTVKEVVKDTVPKILVPINSLK